jgi:hypothetical protein
MANSLKRELKIGDRVRLTNGFSVVVAGRTFGNYPFTSGSALIVKLPEDPPEQEGSRVSGYDIDAAETMRLHAAENGWEAKAPTA